MWVRKSAFTGCCVSADTVEVRTVPTAKWERKGHEFVDLRIVYLVAGEVATEIVHTSIFKIADRRDQEP